MNLRQAGAELGLELRPNASGELWAECAEEEFANRAVSLADRALLTDLFATATPVGTLLAAIFEAPPDPTWLVLRTRLSRDGFRSLTPRLHVASWYEREIHEMYGLVPEGHPAAAPLRLHLAACVAPMMASASRQCPSASAPRAEQLPAVRGRGVFQLPLGPVRSGPQEACQFLFNSGGEDLIMVSPRLGYKLRLVERLAQGKPPEVGLALAERLAGTSAFANGLAFATAVERAAGLEVGPVQQQGRALLAELERLHCHFGDLAALADATGLAVSGAQYGILKEEVLRACTAIAGHRYLRGSLEIGGLAADLSVSARERLRGEVERWRQRAARLADLLEDTATWVDRVEGTGVLAPDYADQHNLVGPTGRASGADRDTRRDHPYAAYAGLRFQVPVRRQGDAHARALIRLLEIEQSLEIVEQLLSGWQDGGVIGQQRGPGSALGWAEAPGGQTLHFVAIDGGGKVVRWRARPPAVVNWHPFAQACASGNNLTDYPVLEASFGLSQAEFDR
jgi:formate hydrogenlyase subunit 5